MTAAVSADPAQVATPPTARYVQQLMGMPISLALRGRHIDDEAARAAWADVVTELRWVDRVFSTYRADSYLCKLGRGEIELADCPVEVAEVLALGETAERDSAGAFAIRRPAPDGTLILDPSGVVKGWAAERAARHLESLPGTDFCVSAGGDLTCRTVDRTGPPWRIGIEDPADPSRVIAVVPVLNGAVATSGTTHRGQHIVDARTGRKPSGLASVTVLARSLTDADIDATAAYAMGTDAAEWLRRRGRRGFIVYSDRTTGVI